MIDLVAGLAFRSALIPTAFTWTHLVLESGRLHHVQGSAVHLDQAISPFAVSNCGGGFLRQKRQRNIKKLPKSVYANMTISEANSSLSCEV